MSRRVDIHAGPLSEEDKQYLTERGRRHLIIQNQRMQEEGAFPTQEDFNRDAEPSWEEEVENMTVAELKDELAGRNLPTTGSKAELQNRLYEAGPED